VEDLAEDYLRRRRAGERPTLEEYENRYPHRDGWPVSPMSPRIRSSITARLRNP
jgi:hypothetical protein